MIIRAPYPDLVAVMAWTPDAMEADNVAWWDAQETSTITITANQVSSWSSRIGNIVATQSDTNFRPAMGTRNGKSVLEFDGNDALPFSGGSSLLGSGDFSISVMAGLNAQSQNYPMVIGIGSSTAGSGRYVFADVDAKKVAGGVGGSNSNVISPVPFGTFMPVVFTGVSATKMIAINSNGSSPTTMTAGPAFTSDATAGALGRWPAFGTSWNGSIAEIVITKRALDTNTRQKMEGYLAHKWGTTGNLPANHPYKSTPPTV